MTDANIQSKNYKAEAGKPAESQSYLWAQRSVGMNPIVLFDYDPTRSSAVPERRYYAAKALARIEEALDKELRLCLKLTGMDPQSARLKLRLADALGEGAKIEVVPSPTSEAMQDAVLAHF